MPKQNNRKIKIESTEDTFGRNLGSKLPESPNSSESESSGPSKIRRQKVTNKSHSIFLESTYQMIDEADPKIAKWSSSGDTFIVKDPTKFAADVIPLYFKHSKFTSFVRQLNFYGFRKLKVDDINIPSAEKHWWEFQHDKFKRGKKELLKEIRRKTCTGADGINQMGQEMISLKNEVATMKEQMADMKGMMEKLTRTIYELTKANESKIDSPNESKIDSNEPKNSSKNDDSPNENENRKRKAETSYIKGNDRKRPNLAPPTPQSFETDMPALTPLGELSLFPVEELDSMFQMATPKGYFNAIEIR